MSRSVSEPGVFSIPAATNGRGATSAARCGTSATVSKPGARAGPMCVPRRVSRFRDQGRRGVQARRPSSSGGRAPPRKSRRHRPDRSRRRRSVAVCIPAERRASRAGSARRRPTDRATSRPIHRASSARRLLWIGGAQRSGWRPASSSRWPAGQGAMTAAHGRRVRPRAGVSSASAFPSRCRRRKADAGAVCGDCLRRMIVGRLTPGSQVSSSGVEATPFASSAFPELGYGEAVVCGRRGRAAVADLAHQEPLADLPMPPDGRAGNR